MIPLMKVHTPKGIGEKLQEVFDSGFLTEGEYSDEFEKQFLDDMLSLDCLGLGDPRNWCEHIGEHCGVIEGIVFDRDYDEEAAAFNLHFPFSLFRRSWFRPSL